LSQLVLLAPKTASLIPPRPPFVVSAATCSTVTGASNRSTELMTSLNQLNPSLGPFFAIHTLTAPISFSLCVFEHASLIYYNAAPQLRDQTKRILQFPDSIKILVCVSVRALCRWVLNLLQSVITTSYSIIITEIYCLYLGWLKGFVHNGLHLPRFGSTTFG